VTSPPETSVSDRNAPASDPSEPQASSAPFHEQADQRPGGDTHQLADGDRPVPTTRQGAPVADDQNSQTAGERGPGLLEDHHLREKLFHVDMKPIGPLRGPRWCSRHRAGSRSGRRSPTRRPCGRGQVIAS